MFILTPAWISLLGNAFWIKATSQETVLERLLQMGKGVRHPAWATRVRVRFRNLRVGRKESVSQRCIYLIA